MCCHRLRLDVFRSIQQFIPPNQTLPNGWASTTAAFTIPNWYSSASQTNFGWILYNYLQKSTESFSCEMKSVSSRKKPHHFFHYNQAVKSTYVRQYSFVRCFLVHFKTVTWNQPPYALVQKMGTEKKSLHVWVTESSMWGSGLFYRADGSISSS